LLKEATKLVQPSLRREGFSSIPDVTWDDVGGLDSLRKEFHRYIRCIKSPEDCDVSYVALTIPSDCVLLLLHYDLAWCL
jgi:SpoVK/Ycf46/Vps4 family AAA+-type ATPase